MPSLPKFFLAENLKFPESSFVIHVFYPRFMVDLMDEKIIWLEDDETSSNFIQLEYRDLISESIDWAIMETDLINEMRSRDVKSIQKETELEFIKKFN